MKTITTNHADGWKGFWGNRQLAPRQEALSTSEPFMLMDDARFDDAGYVLRDMRADISAYCLDEVEPALNQVKQALQNGLYVGGFMAYEAGYAFLQRAPLEVTPTRQQPLLWFGCFRSVDRFASMNDAVPTSGHLNSGIQRRCSRDHYNSILAQTLSYIEAGEIYQANITFPCSFESSADEIEIYGALRCRQKAPWGGLVHTGNDWLISFSPELFFSIRDETIVTKPMKGTVAKFANGRTSQADHVALLSNDKNRAENLMIVDLLRNDLSKIAKPGSVKVPHLFEIEEYPTLFQMTSTIAAEIRDDVDVLDIARAMFPCGSVTGAPKLRAMEIIAELETAPRGAYTGSMGVFCPSGDAAMNVLIRTIEKSATTQRASIGVGSGIVADSCAPDEWLECLAKIAFLTKVE